MKAYTYILKCNDGSYYVGSTENLKQRIADHQSGNGAVHTMRRLPVELVCYERCSSIHDAQKRESELKGWSRTKKEQLIQSVGWQRNTALAAYGLIVNKNDEVLLMLHADKETWMLPGGGIEQGETIQDALTRETFEEIGLRIKNQKLVLLDHRASENQLILVFKVNLEQPEVIELGTEAMQARYFPIDNLPATLAPSHKKRLEAIQSKQLFITS